MRSLAKDALSFIICGTGAMSNSESEKETPMLNYPRYDKKYEERLKTFQGIEMPVEPKLFALAGFYYCGPGDCVVCAYCRGKLEDWSEGTFCHTNHLCNHLIEKVMIRYMNTSNITDTVHLYCHW